MLTYKSESNIQPKEWDIELSCVYHNQNVTRHRKTNEEGKYEYYYEYDVDEYTLHEYIELQSKGIEKNNALVEYVAMMTDVELPEGE